METDNALTKESVLSRFFGYSEFRQGQEPLVDAQLSGRDVLGIMPTGGGKSLCYQVPALMLPGITLVVSPLISLMKDQVMALKNAGVAAAYINSSLTPRQIELVFWNMIQGKYKIIYIAPERLLTDGFLYAVQQCRVSLLAVDEAHCISQWGQDFRPSYLHIPSFLQLLGYRPVVSAFTATATDQVRQDIIRLLALSDPFQLVTGFDRPNLYLHVRRPKDKRSELLALVRERRDKTGIIYCATRADVEAVCDYLTENGISATRYHAGLADEERHCNQDDFIFDRCRVMAATNAFGMGIDKSNVAFVIHYSMPKSMEAYYQEAGRAGRDGADAECILFFAPKDIRTAQFLIENGSENPDIDPQTRQRLLEQDYARLETMVGYCKTRSCLRSYILSYFGQEHQGSCGFCSCCIEQIAMEDITQQAVSVLTCAFQLQNKLGYAMGATTLCGVLRGSRGKRLLELGLDRLPTYGCMKELSASRVRAVVEELEGLGYLKTDYEFSVIRPTEASSDVLSGGCKVSMRMPDDHSCQSVQKQKKPSADGDALFRRLRALRARIAERERVPAYIVFSNATLQDMADKAPRTPEDFLRVSGVGSRKAERYGEIFLREINHALDTYIEE